MVKMRYSVHKEVFEICPDLQFGILIGSNLSHISGREEDALRLRTAEIQIRQKIEPDALRSHPNISGYRAVMEKSGINPNKYPASSEAMIKRVLKEASLPNINGLVDLCNAISLENVISLGGHDLADITEDLSVGLTKGHEKFLPFGSDVYESVEANELVFISGDVVQTRKWVWRQSELGKMTERTQNVFFQLVGFDGEGLDSFSKAMDEVEEMIKTRFNGTCERMVVNSLNPEIEFIKD